MYLKDDVSHLKDEVENMKDEFSKESLATELLSELKSQNKRQHNIIVILIAVIIAMIVAYFIHESQFETVSEENSKVQVDGNEAVYQEDVNNSNISIE